MKSKAFAILLIVLGVGATLGGLYGQIFLAEDEGHHDGTGFSFALESSVGADELIVTSPGPNQAVVQLLRAGQPMNFNDVHDGRSHFFITTADLGWFEHVVVDEPRDLEVDVPAGDVRVVAQVSPDGGPELLELGATVQVAGDALAAQNIVDDDEWTNGELTVRRQQFDFVLSKTWNGSDVYEGPALLTLIRADDFAFTHAHAEVLDGNRFSFATDLPGLGDFLAALQFEQDGELVTALFRFSI